MSTVRVPAEDRRQVETSIDGTLYRARDGYFTMPQQHAAAHLQSGNLPTPAIGRPARRADGYRCGDCGFGSNFIKCGRCGGTCAREG